MPIRPAPMMVHGQSPGAAAIKVVRRERSLHAAASWNKDRPACSTCNIFSRKWMNSSRYKNKNHLLKVLCGAKVFQPAALAKSSARCQVWFRTRFVSSYSREKTKRWPDKSRVCAQLAALAHLVTNDQCPFQSAPCVVS